MKQKCQFNQHVRRAMNILSLLLLFSVFASAQQSEDEDEISPVRPTVSDSATIQKKGVLQFETGGDFDFRTPDYRNRQAMPIAVYFAVSKFLRLDFETESFVSQKSLDGTRETGFGDTQIGFKALLRRSPKKRLAVAFTYSIKLPTASAEKGLGTGETDHNLRFILNRTYGKTNLIFNAAYLNNGRENSSKRDSGAQTVFTVERELSKKFDLVGEVYGNTIEESQPRGIYLLGALVYKINKRFYLDIGGRPGFGSDAPKFGLFAGLTVGIANLYGKK